MSPNAGSAAFVGHRTDTSSQTPDPQRPKKMPKKVGREAARKATLSVRFPRSLYEAAAELALDTDQSVSAIIEQGLHNYFYTYTHSPEFRNRVEQQVSRQKQAAARLTDGSGTAPPRRTGVPVAAGHDRASAASSPTMLRVDPDLEGSLFDLSEALNISITDAVIEATQRWVDHYPTTSVYSDRVRAALERRIGSLKAKGKMDLLTETLNA